MPTTAPRTSTTEALEHAAARFAWSVTDARAHLKVLLDAATQGQAATIQRGPDRVAVVDADALRDALEAGTPVRPVVAREAGEWAVFLPGLPLHGTGDTLTGAVDDLVVALREYAADWATRLRHAPNHADRWALVTLVSLSDDAQLRAWLTRTDA